MGGVDTLGVYEFDTATDTIIGNHVMKEGIGGDPFPSPDGEHIVLIANNGGTSIRILKTGEPGAKSTVYADLELGFDSTGFEEEQSSMIMPLLRGGVEVRLFLPLVQKTRLPSLILQKGPQKSILWYSKK